MYISNIKLWNFRRFGTEKEIGPTSEPSLDLDLTSGLNVIIGENDSGKTAIIDAIKLVLKTHVYDYNRVEDKDFYKGTSRFRIELTLIGFETDEAKNFTEWLGWIDTDKGRVPALKLIYDVRRDGNRIFPSDVRAGVDEEGSILNADAKDLLKVTYLKPLRDAENDLVAKRNSRLSQILLGDSAFKGKEKTHELVGIFKEMSDGLKKYFKGEFAVEVSDEHGTATKHFPQEGKLIKDTIDTYINEFYGDNFQTGFEVAPSDIKNILEKLALILQDYAHPGLGTLNRLFMATELLHLNKAHWTGLRLGLIEELEAHLHPQAQMQVIEALQKQKSIQLILSTHSPNLASKLHIKNLILCSDGHAFPLGEDHTKLDPDDYVFLEKFLDTTKSNLFFARGIILVEGWGEELLISSIAKAIDINLTACGVSVVNIGNVAFGRYSKIFLRRNEPDMKVPVSVLTDSDSREYVHQADETGTKSLVKLEEGVYEAQTNEAVKVRKSKSEKNVQYFVAPFWTLEYCLARSKSLSAEFISVVKTIHPEIDRGRDFESGLADKLLKHTLSKTEIAYQLATIIDKDLALDKSARKICIDATDKSDSIHYLIEAIQHATKH